MELISIWISERALLSPALISTAGNRHMFHSYPTSLNTFWIKQTTIDTFNIYKNLSVKLYLPVGTFVLIMHTKFLWGEGGRRMFSLYSGKNAIQPSFHWLTDVRIKESTAISPSGKHVSGLGERFQPKHSRMHLRIFRSYRNTFLSSVSSFTINHDNIILRQQLSCIPFAQQLHINSPI
jgi:hypothetical protein